MYYYILTPEAVVQKRTLLTASFIALIALLTSYQVVLAHESVPVGDYTVEIGWVNEPPIVGQQNSIVVNVVTTSDEQPVEDVSALTVTVSYGGQNKTLTLQPLGEDTPGQFVAPILPTIPGQYTINLGGKLGDTDVKVDVQPEEVQAADILQFPSGVNAGASEQSTNPASMNWLTYLSLLIGLIALVVGLMALRKSG